MLSTVSEERERGEALMTPMRPITDRANVWIKAVLCVTHGDMNCQSHIFVLQKHNCTVPCKLNVEILDLKGIVHNFSIFGQISYFE